MAYESIGLKGAKTLGDKRVSSLLQFSWENRHESTIPMIPNVGAVWKALDGRIMRVDEVVIPVNPAEMPWCKMSVLNAGKRMRRKTTMSTVNFGSAQASAFLRPIRDGE